MYVPAASHGCHRATPGPIVRKRRTIGAKLNPITILLVFLGREEISGIAYRFRNRRRNHPGIHIAIWTITRGATETTCYPLAHIHMLGSANHRLGSLLDPLHQAAHGRFWKNIPANVFLPGILHL